jgi:hypothetical protein
MEKMAIFKFLENPSIFLEKYGFSKLYNSFWVN